MRLWIFSLSILCLSCQSSSRSKKSTMDDPESKPTFKKVDASTLHAHMDAEDFQNKTHSGLLLKPNLDPQARSIQYKICALPEKTNCVRSEIDGLISEGVYDAPEGEVEISYRPCVPQYMAINKPCGEKTSFTFHHTVKNHVAKSLHLTWNEMHDLVKKIVKAIHQLPDPSHIESHYDDFDILAFNIAVDSRLVTRVFTSATLLGKHMKEVRSLTDSPYDIAIGFLSLGNIDVIDEIIENSNESIEWKESLRREVFRYRHMVSGKKTLKETVDLLSDEHLSPEKKEILKNIQKSFQ